MSEKPGLLVGILIGFILGCLFGLICGKSCRSDAKQRRHFSRPISDPQVQSETPDLLDQAQWLPNTNQPGRYVYREIQVNKVRHGLRDLTNCLAVYRRYSGLT